MNSKIAMSAISIMGSLAIMGGATFAFFSSSATSNNNTFGAGTLNLELDDLDEAFGVDANDDLLTAPFNVSGMAPGDSAAQEISFHNTGSVPAEEIAMGLECTGTDVGSVPSDLCNVLELTIREGGTASEGACTEGTDVTTTIDTAVTGGGLPLTASDFDGDTYDSLAIALAADNVGTTDEGKVCVQVSMDDLAGDIYQGDSADVDLTFTAHQDAATQ